MPAASRHRANLRGPCANRGRYNLGLSSAPIVGAVFLGELRGAGVEDHHRHGVERDLLFGAFLSISSASLVYKDIDRRTIYAIFAKPVAAAVPVAILALLTLLSTSS